MISVINLVLEGSSQEIFTNIGISISGALRAWHFYLGSHFNHHLKHFYTLGFGPR